ADRGRRQTPIVCPTSEIHKLIHIVIHVRVPDPGGPVSVPCDPFCIFFLFGHRRGWRADPRIGRPGALQWPVGVAAVAGLLDLRTTPLAARVYHYVLGTLYPVMAVTMNRNQHAAVADASRIAPRLVLGEAKARQSADDCARYRQGADASQ